MCEIKKSINRNQQKQNNQFNSNKQLHAIHSKTIRRRGLKRVIHYQSKYSSLWLNYMTSKQTIESRPIYNVVQYKNTLERSDVL